MSNRLNILCLFLFLTSGALAQPSELSAKKHRTDDAFQHLLKSVVTNVRAFVS